MVPPRPPHGDRSLRRLNISEPYTIYVDNQQCISFTKNITVNSKLRTTYNMKDKWINELRDDKIIKVSYVSGPADLLTKALPAYKHRVILNIIHNIRTPHDTNSIPDPNPNPDPEDTDSDPDPNPNPNPNTDNSNSNFYSNPLYNNPNPRDDTN